MNVQPISRMFEGYTMRLRMLLFFVGAVAIMVVHHCFYRFLHNKPVGFEDGLSDVAWFLFYYSSSIVNFATIVAKGFIAAILGICFAQVFWMHTRRKHFNVQQINDSLACKDSPTRSLMTIRTTFIFSMFTFLSLSLAVITIFAPGALDLNDGKSNDTCEVQTVNLTNASIAVFDEEGIHYRNPIAQVKGFVGRVLLSGEPLPPVVDFDKFGGETKYDLSFHAPSLNCTNITSTFDFSSALPDPSIEDDDVVVWNAAKTVVNGSLVFTVATRELLPGPNFTVTPGPDPQAVSCIAYESNYTVRVDTGFEDGSAPTVRIRNITQLVPLSPASASSSDSAEVQYYAIVDALTNLLGGNATYDPDVYDFTNDSSIVAYSPLGAALADSPWFWHRPMLRALPSLMRNVSVSILSGALSETGFPTLASIKTPCREDNVYYIYKPLRLFLAYGAGLLIAGLGMALASYAIYVNGQEEPLDFASVLKYVSTNGIKYEDKGGSWMEAV
ncbi:hypothetical protein SCHPADRAFT_297584 [Schizopora paradoxa]|uniref:Uncharacterized protein n=1 Tax=Schizopora paradoxa TaxID=27342 RepID=A0A0H2RRX5_9AGAM|nr:hypothetical protein SCHPADRAFT_297584 [Schizopora paradoxa]